jgi:hypothetical protein
MMDTHFPDCETGFHRHNLGLDDNEPCAECEYIARQLAEHEPLTDIELLYQLFTDYTLLRRPIPF